jgi:hypothetical protein
LEFQKNVECAIYYYNDLKEVYNDMHLRPEPVEENIQMTELMRCPSEFLLVIS